jgi:hypothetical protein
MNMCGSLLQLFFCLTILEQQIANGNPQLPNKKFGKQILDHIDAGVNIAGAVAKKIPDIIPTPEEILEFGKQSIAGLPFEVAASAINKLCE